MRFLGASLFLLLLAVVGCGDDTGGEGGMGGGGDAGAGGTAGSGGSSQPPVEIVRQAIDDLAPAANIGHRGTGETRAGHPFPENSLSSFIAAMDQGADGIELDLEITADGRLIVMHDDTLDGTTDCTGCVSEFTFDEARACRLVDGSGVPTDEHPPTLAEVYEAVPAPGLINVELKVYGSGCQTDTTGPDALVSAALEEVSQLGVASRTFFSSFNEQAAELVKLKEPDYYSALLVSSPELEDVDTAVRLGLDALHPLANVTPETVTAALDAGLQVNVWTVNTLGGMEANLEKGVTAIITDEPAVLAELLSN